MSHVKNTQSLNFVFFVVMVITGHRYSVTQESSNAEGGACLSVIRGAVVAQEARVCGVVPDDEVGAVVKAGITVTA